MKNHDRVLLFLLLAVAVTGKFLDSITFGLTAFGFTTIIADLFLVLSVFANRKYCVPAVLVGFSVFWFVSLGSLLAGKENCGCFGIVDLPVWFSLVLDSFVLVIAFSNILRVFESAVFVSRFGVVVVLVMTTFQLVGFLESEVRFVNGGELVGLHAGDVSELLNGYDGEVLVAKSGCGDCERAMRGMADGGGIALFQVFGVDDVLVEIRSGSDDVLVTASDTFVMPCWLQVEDGIITQYRPFKS